MVPVVTDGPDGAGSSRGGRDDRRFEGQDCQAGHPSSRTALLMPRFGIRMGQIAHPQMEEAGPRYGLLPAQVLDAHLSEADRRLFGPTGGIDLGAAVTSRVEQCGEIEGNELARPP